VAHIKKYGEKWRAEVCIENKRKAKTFKTKRDAVAWSNEQERTGILTRHTLREAIERYIPIATEHKGSQSELSRLKSLISVKFIDTPLEYLTPEMLAAYRDERLKVVAPVSVRREMIILGALFKVAVKEWGWLHESPIVGVLKPPTSKPRRRGISEAEIETIVANLLTKRAGKQVGDMFLLSIETAMRLGELCSLKWNDVDEKIVTLRDTKNGDIRHVPLSQKAREIIKGRNNIGPVSVFTLSPHVASLTFQRSTINGAHFHDARSEAITRLSKKLDVMQLAKMIGHRDLKSLLIYYAESPEVTADKL